MINKTISEEEISNLEKEIKNKLSTDFKHILAEYSSGVYLKWHMDDDEVEGFEALFSGGSDGILWDFHQLAYMYKNYQNWIKQCFLNIDNKYDLIWHNKISFLDVGNGDLIAFDIMDEKDKYPVVFLSHDGSDFHGSRLADNFIEFITKLVK